MKFDWDDVLPNDIKERWHELQCDLDETVKTRFPRYYFSPGKGSTEHTSVHVFVDASKKAYGACAYIMRGSHTSIVMAKNRVAPLKQMTIPQLELMAAVIGARLASHVLSALNYGIPEPTCHC